MSYLHPDDVLARSVALAEPLGDGSGDAWDEVWGEEDWQERVLAAQLEQATLVPGVYEQLSPQALADYPIRPLAPADESAVGTAGSDDGDGPADGPVGLSLREAGEAILARVEALEADRSRLDGRIVDAYGALHTVLDAQLAHRVEGTLGYAAAGVSAGELAVMELTTATAVPAGEAARRLRLATDRDGCAGLRSRLAAGTVSLLHAALIAQECAALAAAEGLDQERAAQVTGAVTERVLTLLPDGSRPGHALIRARLTRVLKKLADPAATRARRTRARARRALWGQLDEDGMGVLSLRTGAEAVVAVLDRVEHLARAMRQAGDPRTLDQLRADLAAEALLRHGYGPCPTHAVAASAGAAAPTGDTDDGASGDVDGGDHGNDAVDVDGNGDGDGFGGQGPGCGCAPAAPAATAWIVVPFEVATGASDAACELPGHGWVTAEHARAVITAPGSVWRWLAVDHATGRALQLGTDRYRPTPAMTEQVRAIDGHCRGPGCQIPANRCDLDHHVPYPHGPTSVANLGPLHRAHHNLKTAGLWACTPLPDTGPGIAATLAARDQRGLAWRTLTGRDYVTYPKSWTEALTDPDAPEHTPPTRHTNAARQEHRDREAQDRRLGWDQPPPF